MRTRNLLITLAVASLGLTGVAEAKPTLEIKTISNRADLIANGNALVDVVLPHGVRPGDVRVFDDNREITDYFAMRPNGHFEGLVKELKHRQENLLTARAPGARGAELKITEHANGGPVFSGPAVKPWICQDSAINKKCDQPAEFNYRYMSSVSNSLSSYDPDNPPADVATTTTDRGVEVPFIIRVETGYMDRDQYKIAVLFDPEKPWAAWSPQKQWNHKLLITHGASCGIDHQAGDAPSVTADTTAADQTPSSSSPTTALGLGFAVMSTALDNSGHNCNLVTQAESLSMAKEHLIEHYGRIRYTIGTGCSGGSLAQQWIANAYPGIYQGILPQCSFPDAWSTGQQLVDYHLDRLYFENPVGWAPGVVWTPSQIALVEGHPNHVNSVVLDTLYWTALADPTNACAGVSDEQRYDPATNPGGVRCTLTDYMINVLGPRRPADWGPQEQQIGHGFAGQPLDNVGVQYGLAALRSGDITPAQFVDLNAKIGGGTIDIEPTEERFSATEPALKNAYRSGAINSTSNMDRVAIIDLRGPDPGAFHDAYRTWAIRARLEREHGTFANHVIWFGHTPLIGDPDYTTEGLLAMDRWLSAVETDKSGRPLAKKIIADRPADIVDRCSNIPGVDAVAGPGPGKVCEQDQVQTKYGTPRTIAGEGIETDINKCQLQPLLQSDYYPITFSAEQWTALRGAFADGVCDYTRPGVDQRDTIPWLTYEDGPGGERLGKPPRSTPLG